VGLPGSRRRRQARARLRHHKANRLGRRLPIPEATAAVIVAQQERVRARFPDTPLGELRLLPLVVANPHGRKPISADWVAGRHRPWVDHPPEILVPTAVQESGQPQTRLVAFHKRRIFPYAYRHTYAQRHAAAGGQDCPVRFRCVGCGHFRTDVSYLPDLEPTWPTCSATASGCARP
jgi:hypothetical protein